MLGITIPHFNSKTLTECWQDGKSYIVNRYIKYKCLKLAETVEKVGSIGIGREISQLCHISCSDAMTRGSQIRKGCIKLKVFPNLIGLIDAILIESISGAILNSLYELRYFNYIK